MQQWLAAHALRPFSFPRGACLDVINAAGQKPVDVAPESMAKIFAGGDAAARAAVGVATSSGDDSSKNHDSSTMLASINLSDTPVPDATEEELQAMTEAELEAYVAAKDREKAALELKNIALIRRRNQILRERCAVRIETERLLGHVPGLASECKKLKSIGSGANGDVYLVEYGHQRLALKRMKVRRSNDLEKWRREVLIQATLSHEHILQYRYYDFDEVNFFIMSEYMDGGSVFSSIKRGRQGVAMSSTRGACPLSFTERVFILHKIAVGMQFIHSNMLIHRDLKLDNVMIDYDSGGNISKVVIGDFGIATHEHGQNVTRTGTPGYMAPEVINSGGIYAYTNAVDAYSFGSCIYHLLTETRPFARCSAKQVLDMASKGDTPGTLTLDHVNNSNHALDVLNTLMVSCWAVPKARPAYSHITKVMEALYLSLACR